MNKVTRNFKNKFKYEFYTLVTDFNEYKEDFGKLFPTYTEEEQKESFDLLVDFWE